MRNNFVTGIITGGIMGLTAGMYATTKMSPRQRRRLVRKGRNVVMDMMDNSRFF